MSYRDKPWFKPPSYNEPSSEPVTRSGSPEWTDLNSADDAEPGTVELPRSTGGRENVKPVGGSRDTSPMHYRRARPDKNEVDLEDHEYMNPDEEGDEVGIDQ